MEDMGKKTKHEKGAGSTPATVQLEKAGVPFKTYEYEHSNDHMDDVTGWKPRRSSDSMSIRCSRR